MRFRSAIITALAVLSVAALGQARDPEIGYNWSADPLASALTRSNVMVGKSFRARVDEKRLEDLTANRPTGHTLKVVVANGLPGSGRVFKTGVAYLDALQRHVAPGRGILIYSSDAGSIALSNGVDRLTASRIVQANADLLKRDRTAGLAQTVQMLDATAAGHPPKLPPPPGLIPVRRPEIATARQSLIPLFILWWLCLIACALTFALFVMRVRSSRTQAMLASRLPMQRSHAEIVTELLYVECYLDLLPDSEERSNALQSRRVAGALLEEAAPFVRTARRPLDFKRAQALLDQARERADQARAAVRLATGETDFAAAVKELEIRVSPKGVGARAAILAPLRDADAIPEADRAACLFCSRPAALGEMRTVTLSSAGERRNVLACELDIEILHSGAVPMLRVMGEGEKPVAWFRSEAYDPYRDYATAEARFALLYPVKESGGVTLRARLTDPAPLPYPCLVTSTGEPTRDPNSADRVALAEPSANLTVFLGLVPPPANAEPPEAVARA